MTCCLSKAELSAGYRHSRLPSLDNAASHDDLLLDCKALFDMTNKCTMINTTDIVMISIDNDHHHYVCCHPEVPLCVLVIFTKTSSTATNVRAWWTRNAELEIPTVSTMLLLR